MGILSGANRWGYFCKEEGLEPGAGSGVPGEDGDGVVYHAFGEMWDVVPEAPRHLRVGHELIPVLVLEPVTGAWLPGAGDRKSAGMRSSVIPSGFILPSLQRRLQRFTGLLTCFIPVVMWPVFGSFVAFAPSESTIPAVMYGGSVPS